MLLLQVLHRDTELFLKDIGRRRNGDIFFLQQANWISREIILPICQQKTNSLWE